MSRTTKEVKPRDQRCECPEVDDGSEGDFWLGYHCPIHGAERGAPHVPTPAQEGE